MKILRVLLISVLFALVPLGVVYGLSPHQTTTPPTVPPEFYPVLIGLFSFVVTQGLKALSTVLAGIPALAWIDISGWGSAIVAFLVTGALFYLNQALALVPGSLQAGLPALWTFLIALFTAFGAHLTIKTIGGYSRQSVRNARLAK